MSNFKYEVEEAGIMSYLLYKVISILWDYIRSTDFKSSIGFQNSLTSLCKDEDMLTSLLLSCCPLLLLYSSLLLPLHPCLTQTSLCKDCSFICAHSSM